VGYVIPVTMAEGRVRKAPSFDLRTLETLQTLHFHPQPPPDLKGLCLPYFKVIVPPIPLLLCLLPFMTSS